MDAFMTPEILVLLMFGTLFTGIFLGFPTAFVLGGVAMLLGFVDMGPDIFGLFITRLFGLMKNYTLLAVPLFLFMGVFMENPGWPSGCSRPCTFCGAACAAALVSAPLPSVHCLQPPQGWSGLPK